MPTRWITNRFTLDDVQKMILAHDQIAAVVSSLRGTNWAGANPCIAALAPVDLWIVDLYNRVEPSWQKYLQRGKAGSSENGSGEPAAASSQESEGETDQSESSE
jgi:hypothetical protein